MANDLETYLNDHLAGSRFAIDLLERLRDTATDPNFRTFIEGLLGEIESDQDVLLELIERVGDKSVLKDAAAWLTEKAIRLKLPLGSDDTLAVFESLEALSLGVLGKRKLWLVLSMASHFNKSLVGPNYSELVDRAQKQHDRIEKQRLLAAERAFSNND